MTDAHPFKPNAGDWKAIAQNADTNPVKAMLLSGWTPDDELTFVDELTGEVTTGGVERMLLDNVSWDVPDDETIYGRILGDDPGIDGPCSFTDVDHLVVFEDTGDAETSRLIVWFEFAPMSQTDEPFAFELIDREIAVLDDAPAGGGGGADNDIPDGALGALDPDTVGEAVINTLMLFGFPEEQAEELAATAVPLLESLMVQPDTEFDAIKNMDFVTAFLVAGFLGNNATVANITGGLTDLLERVTELEETPPSGITDHGALTGLGDNDHPQYVLADDLPGEIAEAIPTHSYSKMKTGRIVHDDTDLVDGEFTDIVLTDPDGGSELTVARSTRIGMLALCLDAGSDSFGWWEITEDGPCTFLGTIESGELFASSSISDSLNHWLLCGRFYEGGETSGRPFWLNRPPA